MRNTSKQSGFTLIELLLYVVIVSSMLLTLSSFFISATDARIKNQSISEVDQQGQAVMDYIVTAVRNADSITSPVVGGTGVSLTLAMPIAGQNPTVFNLTSSQVRVTEGVSAALALSGGKVNISALTFKNLSRPSTPGVVQISFVATRVNNAGRNDYDYQKTFITSVSLR